MASNEMQPRQRIKADWNSVVSLEAPYRISEKSRDIASKKRDIAGLLEVKTHMLTDQWKEVIKKGDKLSQLMSQKSPVLY